MRTRSSNHEILLDATQIAGRGELVVDYDLGPRSYQIILSDTEDPEAVVAIEARNDPDAPPVTLDTISISGRKATAAFCPTAPWLIVNANLISISGNDAAVTVIQGV